MVNIKFDMRDLSDKLKAFLKRYGCNVKIKLKRLGGGSVVLERNYGHTRKSSVIPYDSTDVKVTGIKETGEDSITVYFSGTLTIKGIKTEIKKVNETKGV